MLKGVAVGVAVVEAEAITTGVETSAIMVITATTVDVTGHTHRTDIPGFTGHLQQVFPMA
jgi:hypothetical protein